MLLNIYRREKNGELTLLSQKATGGEDPCHVVTDRERKMVLVSNYSGGSLAVWPLDKDGAPVGEAQVIQHTGKAEILLARKALMFIRSPSRGMKNLQ